MNEYQKIQTVWLRDPATHHKTLLAGQWALPEFAYLADNEWTWTEKVDGTNIRVEWTGEAVVFGGRTDAAQIPAFLLTRLAERFPIIQFKKLDLPPMTLYGEGYGAKIQKGGGNYIKDGVDFVLFDVFCGLWLERHNVEDVGGKLNVPVVPIIGQGGLNAMVAKVRDGFVSHWGAFQAEGIVARPQTELFARNGSRIITKVKTKDFVR